MDEQPIGQCFQALKYIWLLVVCLCFGLYVPMMGEDVSSSYLSPWFGNVFEFQPGISYSRDTAGRVGTHHHRLSSDTTRAFCSLVFVPQWELKTEIVAGKGHSKAHAVHEHLQFRQAGVRLRHVVTHDLAAGAIRCSTGAAFVYSNASQLRDLLQIQRTKYEASVHGSIGYEHVFRDTFFTHLWGSLLYGCGTRGTHWMHGSVHYDLNIGREETTLHCMGLACYYGKGFGNHSISTHSHHPYQRVNYVFIDYGVRYVCNYASVGSLSYEITKRGYARNCPRHQIGMKIAFTVPFSL